MNKFSTNNHRMMRIMLALILAISVSLAGGNAKPARATSAVAISSGDNYTCTLTSEGGVKCWGNNFSGQLGNGTNTSSNIPVDVSGLNIGMIAVSAGGNHTCALTSAGGVQCWGSNDSGQLGNGTNTSSNIPVDVSGLNSGMIAVSAGGNHTCALTSIGGVKCWGYNIDGELGNGTNTNSNIPVNVSGLSSGVAAISAGGGHTCALTSAGEVKCWGRNSVGQLGNGINIYSNTPVSVIGLNSGVVAISAGKNHACALTNAGGVKCWGSNSNDQLGSETLAHSFAAIAVDVSGFDSGVIAISAGGFHTCALTSTGGVKCWGGNLYAQLGDGTHTNSKIPVILIGLNSGVVAISAGFVHTCATTRLNGVQCWGNNFGGALGDGTNVANSTIRVNVVGFSGTPSSQEHDANLTARADAIDAALAQIKATIDSFELVNLDVPVSSRATQSSVDTLLNVVNKIKAQLDAFDLSKLDVNVSSRASQSSVDALSGSVGSMQASVNDLNTRMDTVEQSLNAIQAGMNSCNARISLTAGRNASGLEFYVNTTQAEQRIDPEGITVWISAAQVDPANITVQSVIPGVTQVVLAGYKSADLKNQPLTVEVAAAGYTCSDMTVIP